MAVIIGSARIGENGKATGGKTGDQKQKKIDDFLGEVSMQYIKDFVGKKQYYVIRPKKAIVAVSIASAMKLACNNIHIGYSQNCQRKTVDNLNTKTNINVDCSKLIRDVIYQATGIDVGNFTTANEKQILEASGLFEKAVKYTSTFKVYEGDIFVTTTKGHTGACIEGLSRLGISTPKPNYKYDGVDFSKVFDAIFYSNQNEDLKKAFGTNTTLLFNHFIKFGCNEKSRWGKTIAGFNVQVYATSPKNKDLVKAFGALNIETGANGYNYYKHFCTYGYKENRVTE